jgi:hypothetical protein
LVLVSRLAAMSAQEPRRVIDDFVDTAFAGADNPDTRGGRRLEA